MSNKAIVRSIVTPEKTYSPGMESELEKALSSEQIEDLTKRGALVGEFKGAARTPQSAFPEDYPGFDVLGQVEGMTPERVALMPDEELLAIKGIGAATLKQIREYEK